jgi:cyclic pyranopterin phosphate synthase
LLLSQVSVQFSVDQEASRIEITAQVHSSGKTGVEMEALTTVAVAALTIYDMAKAVERGMRINNIRLVRKSGGKSGDIVLEDK